MMRLASIYGDDLASSRLCLERSGEYVAVEDLATQAGVPRLRGLRDVGDLFARGADVLAELATLDPGSVEPLPREATRLAPPVRWPSKIVCVGLNYAAHIEESRISRPERIVLFSKYPSCLVGDGDDVILPMVTTQLDYEGELALVIGRRARGVSAAEALGYVGGFTIINDISARDLQQAEPQWVRGKALDTFAPLGPVVVDSASAPEIGEMHIRTLVNGEVRQDASCGLMITPVPELIEYISRDITLEPGDLIATGTPAGVALGMEHPVYLADGDEVTVEIAGVGVLTSHIRAAADRR